MVSDTASSTSTVARAIAGVGGASILGAGLWAMVGPQSFYDSVATFDPYNQHLIQDIGAFQIGLGAVLLLAVFLRPPDALVVALLGTGAGSAAHVGSHLIGRELGGNPSVDIPAFTVLAALLLGAGLARFSQLRR